MILAIDPGTVQSGFVEIHSHNDLRVGRHGTYLNADIANHVIDGHAGDVVIEMMDNYGMTVGQSTFRTLVWIGQFMGATWCYEPVLITRRNVKLHMCNSSRATDANVRRAVLNRYEPTGGGKTPEIGIKAQKGPLYNVSGHAMQALALAITFADTSMKYEYKL